MDYGAAWAFSNTLAEKYGRPLAMAAAGGPTTVNFTIIVVAKG